MHVQHAAGAGANSGGGGGRELEFVGDLTSSCMLLDDVRQRSRCPVLLALLDAQCSVYLLSLRLLRAI